MLCLEAFLGNIGSSEFVIAHILLGLNCNTYFIKKGVRNKWICHLLISLNFGTAIAKNRSNYQIASLHRTYT
jgi:hypothetical protein